MEKMLEKGRHKVKGIKRRFLKNPEIFDYTEYGAITQIWNSFGKNLRNLVLNLCNRRSFATVF
jgi:hypothetical protein